MFQLVFYITFSIVIFHLFSLMSTSVIICVRWWYNVLFSCERYGFNVIGRYMISARCCLQPLVDGSFDSCAEIENKGGEHGIFKLRSTSINPVYFNTQQMLPPWPRFCCGIYLVRHYPLALSTNSLGLGDRNALQLVIIGNNKFKKRLEWHVFGGIICTTQPSTPNRVENTKYWIQIISEILLKLN